MEIRLSLFHTHPAFRQFVCLTNWISIEPKKNIIIVTNRKSGECGCRIICSNSKFQLFSPEGVSKAVLTVTECPNGARPVRFSPRISVDCSGIKRRTVTRQSDPLGARKFWLNFSNKGQRMILLPYFKVLSSVPSRRKRDSTKIASSIEKLAHLERSDD